MTAPLRNIGIIAHIDAGKTTLSERLLFYTQRIHSMGEVHDGTATMDYLPEEQERGITITAACTSCQWQGHAINIIDTPGHVDFTIEVERCLRVLDGAVGVFCAVGGVEPQSETVWRQSEQFGVPKLAFINKMDRPGADFAAVLTALRERLGTAPLPLTVPWGAGEDFAGVIDVIHQEYLTFDPNDQGTTIHRAPCDATQAAACADWREKSLETLAEADEVFLEQYLGGAYTVVDIRAALRRATLARAVTPTLCGSALRNIGVQPLLDAVCALLPAPEERPPALAFPVTDKKGKTLAGNADAANDTGGNHPEDAPGIAVPCDPAAPACLLVFKVLLETGRPLCFVRIYAGEVREGDQLRNAASGQDERVGRIYRVHADRREQIPAASAGDIVALVGLRRARTGDTYTAPAHPLLLESITAYAPVITLALEPRNADEGTTLDEALARYAAEDPTLTVQLDEGSGHRYVSGMGELHLDVLVERIRREYRITPRVGHPQVICRETIRKPATATAEFDRELGKEHHYGGVSLAVAPLPRGAGNSLAFGDFLPAEPLKHPRECAKAGFHSSLVEAVAQGVEDTLQSGVLTGYPVQDVAVTITAMLRREGAVTVPGCHMAAGMALREALQAAGPLALEPIMQVEISVPEAYLGPALSLFGTAGGQVDNLLDRAGTKNVQGRAPLRQLFGFSTSLRSATQGRAGLVMKFASFDVV